MICLLLSENGMVFQPFIPNDMLW